jgi:EAL domain-containing protein (putative c-di-GMP-specific phosphodiesterase class I)
MTSAVFLSSATKSPQEESFYNWMIGQACRQLRRWEDAGLPGVPIAIKIPPESVNGIAHIERAILTESRRHDVPVQGLEIEMSESALAATNAAATSTLERLRSAGVGLAVEGFGAGGCSLARLTELNPSRLKIDSRHVQAVPARQPDVLLVRSAVGIAGEIGAEITAAGVQTRAQADFLIATGCRFGQGPLFGEAVTADEAMALLRSPPKPIASLPTQPPAIDSGLRSA